MTDDDDDARWPIAAARAADAKSADDVVVLEVGPVLALCSHFVIASAPNTRQVRAIADEVEAQIAAEPSYRILTLVKLQDLPKMYTGGKLWIETIADNTEYAIVLARVN